MASERTTVYYVRDCHNENFSLYNARCNTFDGIKKASALVWASFGMVKKA